MGARNAKRHLRIISDKTVDLKALESVQIKIRRPVCNGLYTEPRTNSPAKLQTWFSR